MCGDFPNSDQCIPDICIAGDCVEDGDTANEVVCDGDTFCESDACDPANGQCVFTPENEGNVCADFPDSDQCIPDICIDGDCTEDGDTANEVVCNEELCEVCDPADGSCNVDEEDPVCQTGVEICRTPGFWGARGGFDGDGFYKHGQNVTGEVLGDGLDVCGTLITNTILGDGQSATEAICIKGGDPRAKMMRMLMSASLNCALGECSANTTVLVSVCNEVCDTEDSGAYGMCASALGCFNEGGHINSDGSCVPEGEFACTGTDTICDPANPVECNLLNGEECLSFESCHDRLACPDLFDDGEINGSADCFEPLGPASSPKKCNAARQTTPYIFDLPGYGTP